MAFDRPSSPLWWTVPAVGIMLLICLAMLLGGPQPVKAGTSHDSSKEGFRAAYLLLEELGYPVTRSRYPSGGSARWLLFPTGSARDVKQLDAWVQEGGLLVLATDSADFAREMAIPLDIDKTGGNDDTEQATIPDAPRFVGGKTRVTWAEVEAPRESSRVWAKADDKPLVSIHLRGRGEVWLIHRPDFIRNDRIGKADNGVLLCRLAEAVLRERSGPIAFDEFFHGLRERPSIVELLVKPPTVWVTAQALLLLGLLLWHHGPRFGGLRAAAPPSRRSAEEFLDAMTALLQRKGDQADAFRTARDDLKHDMEKALGLPADTAPERVATEAELRRGIDPKRLLRLLTSPGVPADKGGLIKAMQELETIREQLIPRRSHR
jgi:hypothetical protein